MTSYSLKLMRVNSNRSYRRYSSDSPDLEGDIFSSTGKSIIWHILP